MTMRVLIAEDDPMLLPHVASSVRDGGHLVFEAESGDEAFEIFRRSQPEIIISDWMMPGLTGIELCQRVRQSPTTQYPYFIMLTGRDSGGTLQEAFDAGVDDFLSKPPSYESLEVRLKVAERVVRFGRNQQLQRGIIRLCCKCSDVDLGDQEWMKLASALEVLGGRPVSHATCRNCRTSAAAVE